MQANNARPRIQLRSRFEGINKRAGGLAVEKDYAFLLTEDCDVYKADGTPLLFLRRGAITEELAKSTREILRRVAMEHGSTNRGKYAGTPRYVKVDSDGRKKKNSHTLPVPSAVIGYLDRMGGRFPFCRPTAYTAREVEAWKKIVPLAQHVGKLFKENVPARWAAQQAEADRTPSEYVIKGTPFTTLTVNHNIAGRIHTDKGDFGGGFGCISVFRQGHYRGGVFCYPEYRVGVDLQDRDLIFFDPHAFHAVTDFIDAQEGWERISIVYYFREKMVECEPAAKELERAKKRS